MDKIEKQIVWYSSLVITLLLNSGKLLAIRTNRVIPRLWEFNLAEFTFQLIGHLFFCVVLFHINLNNGMVSKLRNERKKMLYIFTNFFFSFAMLVVIGFLQRIIFHNELRRGLYWGTYLGRLMFSVILIGLLIKVVLLMRKSKSQLRENEELKHAYTSASFELLKTQLNPHFLFNSLSALSGVIRENAPLALEYTKHLSKIFRYSLTHPLKELVPLSDELSMFRSFAQLLYMRMENSFQLIDEVGAEFDGHLLPHLTLQPLLENAAKHNFGTTESPLIVKIQWIENKLVITNNLQPIVAESTGIGLVNLNERYRILMHQEIEISKSEGWFIVKIPLKNG